MTLTYTAKIRRARYKTCCRKTARGNVFQSPILAYAAQQRIRKNPGAETVTAFRCTACAFWHLGTPVGLPKEKSIKLPKVKPTKWVVT